MNELLQRILQRHVSQRASIIASLTKMSIVCLGLMESRTPQLQKAQGKLLNIPFCSSFSFCDTVIISLAYGWNVIANCIVVSCHG